jgi:type I restriction enzyme M protein
MRIWYYDLSDIKVGKRTPLTTAHFEDFFRLLPERDESEHSWTVARAEVEARGYNLKAVNPNRKVVVDERTPEEILNAIEVRGREVAEALEMLRLRRN